MKTSEIILCVVQKSFLSLLLPYMSQKAYSKSFASFRQYFSADHSTMYYFFSSFLSGYLRRATSAGLFFRSY